MMTVRPADVNDIPWMLDQLQAFDEFVNTSKKVFPERGLAADKLRELVTGHPVFVSEVDGELTGLIGGILVPHFFNPEIITLTELFWWVAVEHRGSRAAALLFQAFMQCGKDVGADWIVMTLEMNSPVNAGALVKRGFRLHEQTFLYEAA